MMIDDQHIDRPSADEANEEMADGFRKPTPEQERAIREMFDSFGWNAARNDDLGPVF